MTELQLQTACFQWTWNNYPQTRRCIFHVPNGSSRHKIEAMQLKASGVVKGVHDLLFLWQGQLYCFELKVGVNKQTPEQIEWAQAMQAQGATLYEVRDLTTFQSLFLSIITPKD